MVRPGTRAGNGTTLRRARPDQGRLVGGVELLDDLRGRGLLPVMLGELAVGLDVEDDVARWASNSVLVGPWWQDVVVAGVDLHDRETLGVVGNSLCRLEPRRVELFVDRPGAGAHLINRASRLGLARALVYDRLLVCHPL